MSFEATRSKNPREIAYALFDERRGQDPFSHIPRREPGGYMGYDVVLLLVLGALFGIGFVWTPAWYALGGLAIVMTLFYIMQRSGKGQ